MKVVSVNLSVIILLIAISCCFLVHSTEQVENEPAGKPQTISSARSSLATPKLFDFDRFKSFFKKKYGSLMEELARKKIFLGRAFHSFLSLISYKHYKSSSYLKINERSDWTSDELSSLEMRGNNNNKKVVSEETTNSISDVKDIETKLNEIANQHKNEPDYKELVSELKGDAPATKGFMGGLMNSLWSNKSPKEPNPDDKLIHDYRECITPVKSQSKCASCFIFSTLALFEWAHCKETGELKTFSEQYILDCGGLIGLRGCSGGKEKYVSDFSTDYGIELNSNYPYHHQVDTCPYEAGTDPSEMGFLKLASNLEVKEITYKEFDDYIGRMPILLGYGASDKFHHYGGGVDRGETCDLDRGHSMLIVGSGIEDGQEYWLCKNSYGPTWGHEGFYKLSKEAHNCIKDGTIIEITDGNYFKGLNNQYNEKPIKRRLEEINNKSIFSGLFTNILDTFKPKDPNVVTPPSK